jgi:predicted DNA-binding transcriptional regulator AlpA
MNDRDLAVLRDFDQLPDSANVRLPVVARLFSIGRATVWRWTKVKHLPEPRRVGGVTYWNVGELRQCRMLLPRRHEPRSPTIEPNHDDAG